MKKKPICMATPTVYMQRTKQMNTVSRDTVTKSGSAGDVESAAVNPGSRAEAAQLN